MGKIGKRVINKNIHIHTTTKWNNGKHVCIVLSIFLYPISKQQSMKKEKKFTSQQHLDLVIKDSY